MKKLLILTFFFGFSLMATQTQAQEYQKAIGARLGYPLSASFKTFLGGSSNAVEVFANFRSNRVFNDFGWTRFGVGGAYQVHNPLDEVLDNLYWYYGGGATLYFWSYDSGYSAFDDEANVSFGLQAYLGFDYKLEDAPVNFSVDWVPTFFINGYVSGFGAGYGALAVRYTLE